VKPVYVDLKCYNALRRYTMNNFKNESNKAKDIMHDASKKLDSAKIQESVADVKHNLKK